LRQGEKTGGIKKGSNHNNRESGWSEVGGNLTKTSKRKKEMIIIGGRTTFSAQRRGEGK